MDPTTAVLLQTPPRHGIVSGSVDCLAAQCFLRFCGYGNFETVSVEPTRPDQLTKYPTLTFSTEDKKGTTPATATGLDEIARVVKDLDSGLDDVSRSVVDAFGFVVKEVLVPAVAYFMYAVDANYNATHPSMLTRLKLRKVRGAAKAALPGSLRSDYDVENRVFGAAAAINKLLANKKYALGDKPTTLDPLLYASLSFIVHGKWAKGTVSERVQAHVVTDCPRIVKYVEGIRDQFFERYAGTYTLRPVDINVGVSEADVYSPGRTRAVLLLTAFASCFWVLSNAHLIAAMLQVFVDGDVLPEDEGEHQAQAAQ